MKEKNKNFSTGVDEIIIISLGGSLIVPDQIDVEFLKDFKALILEHVAQGKKFVIITGGGKINNRYNSAAKEISEPSDVDLDWIGIAALKLNAELLRVIFSEQANKKVIDNLSNKFSFEKSIVIGSAYEPGKSSDWDAVECAKTIGAKKIINLSNTDYVYDSDPKLNPNAKKIERISWPEYRELIPKEWTSRLNSPFDPVASAAAEEAGLEVDILNGKNIANLEKCLKGENFTGTKIS
ncbi:MAG: UMP kinase [bacterium]|nr:UMP kinase [bacterium]